MKTAEIRMSGTQYRSLRGILFAKEDREGAAFILAGVAKGPERLLLTAHNIWEIPSARGVWHIQAEPSALIEAVNREFERAVVRINIPSGTYTSSTDIVHGQSYSKYIASLCKRIAKPGIKVLFTHEYMSPDELVDWCAENDLAEISRSN